MLLALIDYWKYKKRRGRYSHENLVAQRLYPANEKNFPDYTDYPTGTLLFACTFDSIPSWAVMYCTNSTISHVATFYGDGIVHDCTTSGVIQHSFANYFDGDTYVGIISLPDKGNRPKMRAFMDTTLGHGYNWRGVQSVFLQILFGAHKELPWRLWTDFALATGLLWAVTRWLSPIVDYAFGAVLIGFILVVVANRLFERRVPEPRA